ncbi:MAG: SAM-dependent methyltransferase [Rhodocyclaceae bacterium]|nr:SAM-dependent methyltransferase [Rhodocyclaceae bacterium]
MTQGTLHLIPVPLGELAEADPSQSLPATLLPVIRELRHFVVENAKSARAFLKTVGMPVPIAELDIRELPGRGKIGKSGANTTDWDALLAPAQDGAPIGLLSEAGCPAVADPGADLVHRAHSLGYRVIPHIGPSSLLLALMASGLGGQCFAFHGYLPQEASERQKAIKRLENSSKCADQTQIVIETPYRNANLYNSLIEHLHPETRLCIAVSLTTTEESIRTLAVSAWRKAPPPVLDKRPTVFLFKQ